MSHSTRQVRFWGVWRFAVLAAGIVLVAGNGAWPGPRQARGNPQSPADTVILDGKIWTGTEAPGAKTDASQPTGIAIRDGRIIAVGRDAQVRAQIGENTKTIDARGRRVIPGITDSHTHVISGGFQLARLLLRDVPGRAEFVQAVAAEAKTKKGGQWVLGGRWSVESWENPEPPKKEWLDPVTGDVPVYLTRMDGHQALVNSAALRLAGIDASGPPDPKGGEIQRDPKTREPTGILKESAMELVGRLIPDATAAERYEAFRRAMRHANSLGVTAVHDMCSRDDLEIFGWAERDGMLTLRITAYLSVSDWPAYVDKVPTYDLNSDMVRLAGLKGFMDGSLGSRTAYMREPYSDATPETPYPRGQLTAEADPLESFQQRVALADARGLQVAVHSIGDEGNHLLLNAYETTLGQGGRRDARHRIEHAQHLHVTDISRFSKLGVVASMQPFHKADDGRYAEKAIGKKRLEGSYAFRQLVDAGALLIFGSDWPVVTMNPFLGIDSAVNAKTLAGEVWLPSHSLTVDEALRAYTSLPPRAVHRDDRFGTIEVGKYADLVILAEDPFAIPQDRIGEVKVDQTILAGRTVFSRDKSE